MQIDLNQVVLRKGSPRREGKSDIVCWGEGACIGRQGTGLCMSQDLNGMWE